MAAALSADAQTSQQPQERSPSPPFNGKRKRESESEQDPGLEQAAAGHDDRELLEDLVFVLKSEFPAYSDISSRSITTVAGGDPSAKRAKLSPPAPEADATTTTLEKQLEAGEYSKLDDFVRDLDAAVDGYAEENATQTASADTPKPVAGPRSHLVQAARAMQAEVHDMVAAERQLNAPGALSPVSGKGAATGSTQGKPSRGLKLANDHALGQEVLSVFGADYKYRDGGRQWFASRKDAPSDHTDEQDPVASANLPAVVSVTGIKSMGRPTHRKPKKMVTLGELYGSSSPAMALKPPQPPTNGVTRSQAVEWYKPSAEYPSSRPVLKDSHINSRMPVGQWLEYYSRADAEESTAEKRLKRDRTLSGGGEGPDPAELEFLQQSSLSRARAKKTSLFRSCFSSFAPSHDDTHAIIPAQTRARVWWERTGATQYHQLMYPEEDLSLEERLRALDPQLKDEPPTEEEIKALEQAVDDYVAAPDDEVDDGNQAPDTDELLQDISENIENLILYQQERLKNVSSSAKGTNTQTPSAAEEELYEMMKMQLMTIVSTLPPAAVARLDGDKLKKLNVSTAIPISVPSYPGLMDMSDKTAAARAPAATASTGVPGRTGYHQNMGTPQSQQRTPAQQPRSAYAAGGSVNRPAIPHQYSVQQPGRYAGQYTGQQSQASPIPNGYPQQPGAYRLNASSATSTPTRHSNQYGTRPPQSFQARPSSYQNMNTAQMSPPPTTPGRQGSPQRPGSYNVGQGRGTYAVNQGQQNSSQQSQQMSAGHAASVYRPPSGGNSAPQGAVGTIGAYIELSPEEQQALKLRQSSGSPLVAQHKPPPPPQTQTLPHSPGIQKPTTNGVNQVSPSRQQPAAGAGASNGA